MYMESPEDSTALLIEAIMCQMYHFPANTAPGRLLLKAELVLLKGCSQVRVVQR